MRDGRVTIKSYLGLEEEAYRHVISKAVVRIDWGRYVEFSDMPKEVQKDYLNRINFLLLSLGIFSTNEEETYRLEDKFSYFQPQVNSNVLYFTRKSDARRYAGARGISCNIVGPRTRIDKLRDFLLGFFRSRELKSTQQP